MSLCKNRKSSVARTRGGTILSASIFNFHVAFHSAHMDRSPLLASLDESNIDSSRKLTARAIKIEIRNNGEISSFNKILMINPEIDNKSRDVY